MRRKGMNKFVVWEDRRTQAACAEEADELEIKAVELGECSLDCVAIDEIATGQFLENQTLGESENHLPIPSQESTEESINRKTRELMKELERNDVRRDDASAGLAAEIERRIALLKDAYPFVANRGSLQFKASNDVTESVYLSLLKLSLGGHDVDRGSFENVVANALEAYLGRGRAKAMPFGWRSETEEDRPRRFKEMMSALHALSGEWHWRPKSGFPEDPSPRDVKDCGIDVVAWIPMPDRRIGQVFIVAQCATGQNWEGKLHDVNWARLSNWIESVPEKWGGTRCFAVPYHVPNTVRWFEVSGDGGLLLDRARITLLLQESPPTA